MQDMSPFTFMLLDAIISICRCLWSFCLMTPIAGCEFLRKRGRKLKIDTYGGRVTIAGGALTLLRKAKRISLIAKAISKK